jgi:asparagine synthase (glutamine-hydrolysing)
MLSGQGADELFGGYPRYLGEKYQFLFPSFFKYFRKIFSGRIRNEQLRRSFYSLPEKDELKRFFYIYSVFLPEEKLKLYNNQFKREIEIEGAKKYIKPFFSRFTNHKALDKMFYIDSRFSLSDNLLLAGDKMSMAASVEVRVPFLDIDLVKLVESIPACLKIKGLNLKYIHKMNSRNFLPAEIINRKKIGFANPMEKWFTRNFDNYFNAMLNDKNSIANMYFNKNFINEMFESHKKGKLDYKRHLFLIYSLNSWFDAFFK